MNGIIHFEIQAGDPERAATFYRNVFGWEIHEWSIPGVKMKIVTGLSRLGRNPNRESMEASSSVRVQHLSRDSR